MTSSTPGNQSELQLYRVLQRANLLQYYDTFIAQGGDDVQQLCEAGEDEFLEIMALVGMASKPLHVRRLQKALQEWVTNPDDFCTPAMFQSTVGSPAPGSITAAVQRSGMPVYPPAQPTSQAQAARPVVPETVPTVVTAPTWSPQVARPTNMDSVSPSPSASYTYTHSPGASHDASNNSPPQLHQGDEVDLRRGSPQPTPVLVESQIRSIAEAAEKLVPNLPHFEPKPLNMRKQINQEIEEVMKLPLDGPDRMDMIRKYSAIYGRFDSKRKNDKPMSLHEISVNEAAAQLCRHIPALLTRREDLFPLARQVVRDSGYQYSKGHSRSHNNSPVAASRGTVLPGESPLKKAKYAEYQKQYDMGGNIDPFKREVNEKMHLLNQELYHIAQRHEEIKFQIQEAKDNENVQLLQELQADVDVLNTRQHMLLQEQSELARKVKQSQKKSRGRPANATEVISLDEDTDSSNLPSGSSSPQQQAYDQNGYHNEEELDFTKHDYYSVPPKKNAQRTRQFVQETLFDEGLRIAQQYGMEDFAEELMGLKQTNPEDGESPSAEQGTGTDDNRESASSKSTKEGAVDNVEIGANGHSAPTNGHSQSNGGGDTVISIETVEDFSSENNESKIGGGSLVIVNGAEEQVGPVELRKNSSGEQDRITEQA